ncbi:MAG TPA: DUF2238 domain-containing protein [Burkholderiales bacterium]
MQLIAYRRYLLVLASLFAVVWIWSGVHPVDRATWVLENVLVVAFVLAVAASCRVFRFSRVSYALIFLFLCLHAVGSHYTYSLVPYDRWFQTVFGFSLDAALGFERNHFDRFVHFAYGLLLAYPVREIFIRIVDVRGFWGYFLPLDITLSTSALYELIEWAAAAVFGGDLGAAYLGAQGDPWDAHKDMALAGAGALLAMLATVIVNYHTQRDFAAEWAESFRIKRPHPPGEDARRWGRRTTASAGR